MAKELMPWAQALADEFDEIYGDRGCTCFISPPCSHCTHPGNPLSLECDDDAWGEIHEVMAAEATEFISRVVENVAERHLIEMRAEWARYAARGATPIPD